jgi:hypothetical protein
MISILLLGFDRPGRSAAAPGDVVRTLASLVSATVEGVVRDLCLAGPPDGRALADIADHAGCGFAGSAVFGEAVRIGARQLRCPHVLVVTPGVAVGRPVAEEISSLMPALASRVGAFYLVKAERRDLAGRLFPALAPDAGLLGPRGWLEQVRSDNFAGLVRQAKPRHTLRAFAWPGV